MSQSENGIYEKEMGEHYFSSLACRRTGAGVEGKCERREEREEREREGDREGERGLADATDTGGVSELERVCFILWLVPACRTRRDRQNEGRESDM